MRQVTHAALGDDLSDATERVLEDVARDLDGATSHLVLVFAAPGLSDAMAERLDEAFPEAAVLGCNAGGVVGGHRELEGRSAIAVTALSLPGASIHVQAFGPELGRKLEARHLRASLAPDGVDPALVLCLLDPKAGEPEPLLSAIDEAFPDAVVSGGLASGAIQGPCLLVDGRVSGAGGVLVAVEGPIRARALVAQGCRPIGQPMLVTRVEGQLVYELGQKRPVDVMRTLHEQLEGKDKELFERALFMGVEMRDQLEYRAGDFLIRNVIGVEPKSGALAVGAEIEPWKAVQFHLRDAESSAEDLDRLLETARAELGDAPRGALLFSCLGRGEGLYGEPSHDTRAVRQRFTDLPVGGFFCNGEIGRVGKTTYLHGYTSSIVFLSERRD